MTFLWLLLLFFLKTSLCKPNNASRVIGGRDAYAGQFPYAVAINVETDDSKFFCGGTLIWPQWVLTSGHCVNGGVLFTIQLGSTKLTEEDLYRVTVASSEYFLHPNFDANSIQNDIGLIKLRVPVVLSDYVKSVSLPTNILYNNTGVTILGWGQMSDSDATMSETLQYVYVTAMPNIQCQMIYGSQISDEMVCVQGNYNEGMCIGDTGGALIEYLGRNSRVVGIASFVSGNGCENTDPSGYTRTFPFTSWILDTIVDNSE